jgi:hypothetical protein
LKPSFRAFHRFLKSKAFMSGIPSIASFSKASHVPSNSKSTSKYFNDRSACQIKSVIDGIPLKSNRISYTTCKRGMTALMRNWLLVVKYREARPTHDTVIPRMQSLFEKQSVHERNPVDCEL